MNPLRTLLNRLADAASYWLQTPFDAADELWAHPKPRDGADRLAEREAEEEVAEPGPTGTIRDGLISDIEGDRMDLIIGYLAEMRDLLSNASSASKEVGPFYVETFGTPFLDTTSAAPDIRSSVDAADGPRGTAAQPETRAGHPNPQ
jgi:hypothetical protein